MNPIQKSSAAVSPPRPGRPRRRSANWWYLALVALWASASASGAAEAPAVPAVPPLAEVSADATFAFARAKLLADRGELAAAERAFEEALELGGDAYGLLEAAKFQLYLVQIGREGAQQSAHVDRAAELVNAAYGLAPTNPDVLRMYADVHWRRSDKDPDALSRAQAAFETLSQDGDLHALTSLAQIYLWQGRAGEAADLLLHAADLAPRNRMLTSMLVDALLGAERETEAEEALTLLLELDPTHLEGRVRLAELRSRRGDHAGAVAVLQAAPDDVRDRLRMNQLLSRELHLAGRHQEALAISDAMLQDDPRSPGYYRLRMSILVSLARYQDAIQLLAPRLPGDDARQRAQDVMLLARLQERVGRADEAAALLRKELETTPAELVREMKLALAGVKQRGGEAAAASQLVEPMIADAGLEELPVLVQSLAELWLEQDRAEDAVRLLDSAVERLVAAGSDDAARALRVRQLVDLAAAERWQLVLDKVTALEVADAPDELRSAAAQLRADALAGLGHWDKAIEQLAKGDEPPELRAKRLQLMLRHGRSDAAMTELDQLASSGDRTDLLFVARVLQSENLHARAVPILRRAVDADAESLAARFMLGAALERSGDFDGASATFESLLEKSPEHVPTLNYLGYMWAERAHNLEQALEFIVRAVAAEPDNGAYVDSLGWAYFRMGRYDEARQHLEWASRLERDDPTVVYHLADAYAALGLHDDARDAYRRALELDAEADSEGELGESLRAELEHKLEQLDRSGS